MTGRKETPREHDERIARRADELVSRAEKTGAAQQTLFLTPAEQAEIVSHAPGCLLEGGYEGAERRIAVFPGDSSEYEPPIVCLRIAPVSRKFSEELQHRDFLGAVMNLGIVRGMTGDIVVTDREGYLFCMRSVADYIAENLTRVRNTTVAVTMEPLPEKYVRGGEERSVVVPSERLDALISAVWHIPREDSKMLVEKGLVSVDSRLAVKPGMTLGEGSLVSVRGKGRFRYLSIERETKKGRLRVTVSMNG